MDAAGTRGLTQGPSKGRGRILLSLFLALAAGPGWGDERLKRSFATGPVKGSIELEPAKPLIGDTVTLTITASAQKDVELLMPEFGEALDRFEILEFVPRSTMDSQGGTLARQIYQLQPPSSGAHSIPPILIEFVDRRVGKPPAPEGQDAYEILTERIDFEVQSVLPADAEADLKPPLGKLAPRVAYRPRRWPWLLVPIALLAAASPLLWRAWWNWRRRARRRSAYDVARGRLGRLMSRPLPQGDLLDAFFVELSSIVRRYLENRFELRAPELTTEEFLASVGRSAELSRDHQLLLREFLQQADLVKFAAARPAPESVDHSVRAAERFLEETRENAPLISVSDPREEAARQQPSRTPGAAQRAEAKSGGKSE